VAATPFLKRGFCGKPIGMWGPNPNRNPNYGGPWLWRAVTFDTALITLQKRFLRNSNRLS